MALLQSYLKNFPLRLFSDHINRFRAFSSSTTVLSNAKTIDKKNDYDIIVTGGGMVGTAMAAALGHDSTFDGKRVLLLESGPQISYETTPEQYSSRVCALSDATKSLLSSFGAWDNILRYQKVKHMKIWDSCSDVGISFGYGKLPPPITDLACIAENDLIVSAIVKQLLKTKVEIKYNSKVVSYDLRKSNETIEDLPSVTLNNGESYRSKLLIGADGTNSMLRKTAGISTISLSYHQNAVVATVQISGGVTNDTAWQRFLPTGPIALLPLSDEFSCLIWTTTAEHAKGLLAMDSCDFVDSINNAFNTSAYHDQSVYSIAKTIESVLFASGLGESSVKQLPPKVLHFDSDSRKAFPLGLCHASHYVRPRMALIGDAAHRVHPLSGQGVNLGFGDVACLVEVLREAVSRGGDIGCMTSLASYETQRQRRVLPMMATIDALNRFYGNDFPPFVLLRSIGCQVTDSLPYVKEKMVQFANY